MSINVNFKQIKMWWEIVFDDSWWYHFRTYPYFETNTGFQLISRYVNISCFWDNYWNYYKCHCQFLSIYALTYQNKKEKYSQNRNKNKLLLNNLKISTALRNQIINIICSYNIDLTRNVENCLFKILENKSMIFSNFTDKMWKLRIEK